MATISAVKQSRRETMGRGYNIIDSDGHILEPLTLWNDYMDPAFRDRAPKLGSDKDGKERLLVEEQVLGSQQGMGGIGGVGARQGVVSSETMKYEEGRPGGFDPHKRIPRYGSRRHRRRVPLSEHGVIRRRGARSESRRRVVPRLQSLAHRLLQAVS